ncbi:hypothetical protein D4764_12G0010740 [Takifugu flavidus]|uniref:Uncharacterized protein n=1 Tax=Takifugu flavidus TaxID=433684 RepID=A0A5C6PD07_9TELE|nr:hypothetical protein D4764_12G0010740 [Takifugu flavidus]
MKTECLLHLLAAEEKEHPSIIYRLSGVGSQGQQPKQRGPDFPLPSYFFQLAWGDSQAFPDQSRDSRSNMSWVFPGASYWRDKPRTPHQGGVQGAS